MPSWKRLNDSLGTWVNIKNMYRLNDTAGNWVRIKRAFRLNDIYGTWVKVFDALSDLPVNTISPVLQTGSGSTTVFTQIDTITLDRGTWDNMTSEFAPTSYSLQIQSSTTGSGGWTDVATGTGSTISYSITLADVVSSSLYFRGRVTATNVNGPTTVNTTPVRSNMSVIVSLNSAPVVTDTDIFVAWTIVRPTNGTYLSSQKVEVFNASSNALLYTANISLSSASIYSHSIPTSSLPASTLVYVKVTAVGNDSALTTASDLSANFLTPLSGTVTISPSSANRVEAGTSVSAVLADWPSGTTFTYEWKWQQESGTIFTLSTTSSATVPSASGTQITLSVTGTYGGQTKTVTTASHRIHPQAPSFTISGGTVISITSVSATGATHYYGSFTGPTSGSITERTLATNTTIQGQPAGNYSITLTSRAYLNSVAYDSYNTTTQSATIISLTPPTITGITFTEPRTFQISFTGGSGPYYQIWWNTTGSAPGSLDLGYDAAGTSSPVSESLLPVDENTYYFWIRSSTENLGNTTTAGNATLGTFSDWSSSSSIKPFARPTSLSASTNDKTGITLTWSGGAAPEYQVYWIGNTTTKPTDKSPTFDFSAGSASPYKWTGATRGTQYYFYIRGNITDGALEYYTNWFPTAAPGINGRAPFYAPGTPTGLTGTVQSSSQIDISWTAPTTNSTQDAATGYDIYYSTSSSAPNAFTTPTTTSTTTSKSITGLTASTTYYFWVRATNVDNTGSNASAWTASINRTTNAANVAPSGGSLNSNVVTSGTAGRIGVTYSVSINTEATGTPTPTKSYQWQVFNGPSSSYVNLVGATSSSYTVPWTASDSLGNTVQMPSQLIRCRVTWSNSEGSQVVNSSSNLIEAPTITGVTAALSTASPFIVYRCYGYNFRSIGSKNSYGSSTPPSTTDANYTYSQSGNSTIPITRQSSNGGDLFYYSLEVIPYTTVGTGSAPAAGTISGSTRFTSIIRNNATNRTNSPVNVYGTGSA